MSLLSVVIPIYNGSKYLKDTIDMVLNSTYSDLEIIAVNDGSTDNSAEIVTAIQKQDDRVKLFNKENGGVVSSRNYGVEHANGTYLCFVDQDDFVKPFMYEKLISKMLEDGSDMAMCSSGRNVNGNESVFNSLSDGKFVGEELREALLYPMLFNGYNVNTKHAGGSHYPHIWNCVFRKDFWDKSNLRFRAYINFEDDLLVKVEALSKAHIVSTISDVGYLWRVNLKSETYAKHFVENIGQKQDIVYQDLLSSIMVNSPSEEFLREFKMVTLCRQYLDAIHYLSSPEVKKTSAFIRDFYENNIYNRDFDEVIQGYKLVKKGMVKAKLILPLLSKRKTLLSYRIELILDKVLLFTLHSTFLTKLERQIKKNN